MKKINLLENAPPAKRKFDSSWRTDENREIAKKFGKDYFDGERVNGYGGYVYDGRWKAVAKKLNEIYGLNNESSFLEVGCAKGFLLYDLQEMFPGIRVAGLDISKYAIEHAMDGHADIQTSKEKVIPFMVMGSADNLPYADNSFDIVISINTLHNLPIEKCKKAIQEMIRVCKGNKMFIQVDSYENDIQKKALDAWNLTALTTLSPEEWLELFKEVGYEGDYFWTLLNPE